jgi:thiol-disulfide isomerase/thioredoxin
MGQESAFSVATPGPANQDEDERDEGRIGYGRYARFTPLALALLLIAGLTAAGIARTGGGGDDRAADGPRPSDLPGRPAPDVTLHLLDGGDLRLADLRGAVVVVNFWATWCDPCQEEMPTLQRLATAGAVEGVPVEVVGVGSKVRDTDESARAFLQALGITYPVARDAGGDAPHRGAIGQAFGQQDFLPMTVVIRPDGIVAGVRYGPLEDDELRDLVVAAGAPGA